MTWEGVLNDIELVPFSTAEQAIDALGKLSRPELSPARPAAGGCRTTRT